MNRRGFRKPREQCDRWKFCVRDPPFSILINIISDLANHENALSSLFPPTFCFFFFSFFLEKTQKLFFSASQISTPSSMAVSSSSMCLNAGRLPPARSISSPSRLFPVTSFSPRSLLISDRRSLVSSSGSGLRFSALCLRDSKGTDDN